MSYQALYRKYRSQTFSEMVGQENISNALKNEIKTGKISHAYLFSGPRGTGKTSAAKIFAKAVNCPNQQDGEPCNQCEVCQQITDGIYDDVLEIDAASNNGVDEIRELRDKVNYAPTQGQYKVYIIDEVHMLSTGAFNALLKTLEEPPANVVFILATTELHKVPATILSRVERFQFNSIQVEQIQQHLSRILDENQVRYEDDAIVAIAKAALGGMRDALSLLDQALSLDDKQLTTDNALIVSGLLSEQFKDDYVSAIINHDASSAIESLNQLYDEGVQINRIVDELLAYLRDLLLFQKTKHLQVVPTEKFQINSKASTELIIKLINQANQALENLRFSTQPKLIAEVLTIELANQQPSVQANDESLEGHALIQNLKEEIDSLRREVNQLKHNQSQNAEKPAASPKQSIKKPLAKVTVSKDEIVAVLKAAEKQKLLDVLRVWDEFLAHLSPVQRALLNASQPVAASQHGVVLDFSEEILAKKAMENEQLPDEFENLLSNLVGFSPKMIGIGHDNWLPIRDQYRAQFRANQKVQNDSEQDDAVNDRLKKEASAHQAFVDEAKNLFGDIVTDVDEVKS
ncbi:MULTISPECIES: DNA polymerase III subunit gamma/tau [unclassified Enterococcus]|uniref:DNA polymerase III subunit gamma/tau n=1 Tax=unclassified Enterococcus TaxID=2608891 RepID=UPI001554E550|nr:MULTISPECIES: DNA polymerase III subunit gamma/tau [unclassified Enterococcus]MBS7576606.1 DNA polymerase III subunit gamma/tau [Enterococcus sp. MMGLQ5-2]MBS7583907.1 DNA polymerase III subunit gamma/tau [Enterococcus sp. MMGLQ5-1]NPD11768.1 DNA polymerase III subunit gamma/tau [Enterococcus sp. MMGLQ5-1]NPD36443.1 DNA polymerase III subunit gamma/tau [Enterococcus sp. MMGLQ5-2]